MTQPEQIYLKPGEIHCSETPVLYKTVLGSCVSVCMWDQQLGIGGLNHFVLPRSRAGEVDARFGDVAVPQLIQRLTALGCQDLAAKVFGGAAVLAVGSTITVGDSNTEMALTQLQRHRIPILARRTGGRLGVVIHFLSASGDVLLREIPPGPNLIKAA